MPTLTSSTVSRSPAPAVCCCPACEGLECLSRTRFFAGQLLTEADLNNEQAYLLAKNRLHNRYLVGTGIVCGLQVICSDCDGWVTVKAGYAIDGCGNDIIVCADQPFNVAAAISACCRPAQQSNCTPPRPAPPATCKDAEQKWCITIKYNELPTRSVAPLRSSGSSGLGCGCGWGGSSKGGCGCGSKNGSSASSSCCCSSVTPSVPATTTACEPTRILESFQFGVCQAPDSLTTNKPPLTGMAAQISACVQPLHQLILQAPDFEKQGITNESAAYAATCSYLAAVKRYLASSPTTQCTTRAGLYGMQIFNANATVATLQSQVTSIVQQLSTLVIECVCLAAMPSCPPSPCDDCLVLACVTMRNGQIVDICHFDGGRKQIISIPSLIYWLSVLGIDPQQSLNSKLEELCCTPQQQNDQNAKYASAFRSVTLPAENISTAAFTNATLFGQVFSAGIAQQIGATLLNAATASNDTVDLRPLIGQDLQSVSSTLNRLKITSTVTDASQWSDYAVAASAPSAFPSGQPLTVLTSGQLVVGFQTTSPTAQLQLQLARLQQQVDALQKHIGDTTNSRSRKG